MARVGLLTSSASRQGGGVFEAVVWQAELLRDCGHEPIVFALEDEDSQKDATRFGPVEVRTCGVAGPRMIGYSPKLVPQLCEARLDLLHLHGIWMYPSWAGSAWRHRTGRPYVISPHGMLDPWITSRGTGKKALAKLAYERRSWRAASCFHALTSSEADNIRVETRNESVVVIPNSVTAEPVATDASRSAPYCLYLGRIHPKKNLAALVEAWSLAHEVLSQFGANLVIAGWGDPDHVKDLNDWIAPYKDGSVEFVGAVYGAEKAKLLAAARFVALPSFSEGLPVVILEAWASGRPTLMSVHCNLPEGFAAGAAADCGTTPRSIADALIAGFGLGDGRWLSMSVAASDLASRLFSPAGIASRWREVYDDLLAGTECPDPPRVR